MAGRPGGPNCGGWGARATPARGGSGGGRRERGAARRPPRTTEPPRHEGRPSRRAPGPARLAIVIDDLGYTLEATQRFLALGYPLTYSILPDVPHAQESAALVHAAGGGVGQILCRWAKALGAFVGLIIVNCIILARQEAFASRNPVGRSVLDAIGTGVGFTIAMLMMGSIREILGAGTFLGVHLFGPHFEPWVIFSLPPGGFLTLGFILLFLSWKQRRSEIRAKIREWPEGVAARKAA